MYTLTNREYVSKKRDDSKPKEEVVGRISDEKLGELNLIIKTDTQGKPILHEEGDKIPMSLVGETIPMGLAEVADNKTTCYFREKGKTEITYHWDSHKDRPVDDLSGQEIKLYRNKFVFKRALNHLAKTSLGPVLAGLDGMNGQQMTLSAFEKKINQLRDDPEDQYIFTLTRDKLIKAGLMPVDENGKPHDLSLMHVPSFDVESFGIKMVDRDSELFQYVWNFYEQTNKNKKRDTDAAFAKAVNLLKIENPAVFVKTYNHLVEDEFIPKSHSEAEINLSAEQFNHLKEVYKITVEEFDENSAIEGAFDYINHRMNSYNRKKGKPTDFNILEQSPAWIAKNIRILNAWLPQMRHQSIGHEAQYWEFCNQIKGMNNTIYLDEPSYPERKGTLFKAVAQKQAKATLESRL